MLQASFFKISLTPYYSTSVDVNILLCESLEMQMIIEKTFEKRNLGSGTKKINFSKKFKIFTFFGSHVQPSSAFLTSIKSIDRKILPASIILCSRSSCIGKCSQIKIWMYGDIFNLSFKSLALPKCCRPHFSRFSWHRITLRVWMWTSCSTSH